MIKFILLSNFCRYNSLIYDQLLFSVIVLAPPNIRRKQMERQDRGGLVDGGGGETVGG